MPAVQERFLRLHGTNLEAFCKRHGLEPHDGQCHRCKCTLRIDVPFVWMLGKQKLYGLTTEPCACGNAQTPFEIMGLFR